MSDYTLPDGKEITFDLNKISRREYISLLDTNQEEEESYKVLSKACNLSADEIGNMGQLDFRKFMSIFWERAREPLSDPNA